MNFTYAEKRCHWQFFPSLYMLNGTNIAIFQASLSQLSVLHIQHAHAGYGDTAEQNSKDKNTFPAALY